MTGWPRVPAVSRRRFPDRRVANWDMVESRRGRGPQAALERRGEAGKPADLNPSTVLPHFIVEVPQTHVFPRIGLPFTQGGLVAKISLET